MPYSIKEEVEFWGQFSSGSFQRIPTNWNYETIIQYLIDIADGEIDGYCRVPQGFFADNGVAIQDELHDGRDLPSGSKKVLTPKYTPILSVSKLEFYENSAWGAKTEGIDNDYIVGTYWVRLIDWPDTTTYRNIRLSYRAGYSLTPKVVSEISARLAAAIGQQIVASRILNIARPLGTLVMECFKPSLKAKLMSYRLDNVSVRRG